MSSGPHLLVRWVRRREGIPYRRNTYICTPLEEEAGPTNNWAPPAEMYSKLYKMAEGSMRGRTMCVVPYLMGPPGSPLSKVGIELTDSIYVVLSMGVMTRVGALPTSTWATAGISIAVCTVSWMSILSAD